MKENITYILQCANEMNLDTEFPDLKQLYIDTNQLYFKHIPMLEPCCTRKHHPSDNPTEILNIYGCNIQEIIQMKEWFLQAAAYIHHAVSIEHKKIMVGCAYGMNRSVSSVLTYFMVYLNIPLFDSLYYIKLHRSNIYPNLETFSALLLIEYDRIEKYYGKKPTNICSLFPLLSVSSASSSSSDTTLSGSLTTVPMDSDKKNYKTISIANNNNNQDHQLSITPEDLFKYHCWASKALTNHKLRNEKLPIHNSEN